MKYILIFTIVMTFFAIIMPDSNAVILREGTFLKAFTTTDISTLLYDIGDEVCVVNTSDMYVYETNVIPKSSVICGNVEDLKEPVKGRNGAIKIRLNKVTTPDKRIFPIDAYIYSPNNNYFGGEYTSAEYYQKVPHYGTRFKPMLKYAPLNILKDGQHTLIKAGTEVFVVLFSSIDTDNM